MKYYYLIPSLPVLSLDSDQGQEDLEELLTFIKRNLTEEDQKVFECLLHYSDNQNLLYILFHEYHDFDMHGFNQPGAIPIEALKNYRRSYPGFPDYMGRFLQDFSGSFSSFAPRDMEHHLHTYFYEYQEKLNSEFLNTYSLWRFRLKRMVADLNRKLYPFLHTKSDSAEPFFANRQILHGLQNLEEMSTVMLPLLESSDLEAIENQINAYYFDFANSWTEPFAPEQVFAYTLKIIRLHRWKDFAAKGHNAKEAFESRIEDLKKREPSPKMSMI